MRLKYVPAGARARYGKACRTRSLAAAATRQALGSQLASGKVGLYLTIPKKKRFELVKKHRLLFWIQPVPREIDQDRI
jgi:hypothetical protein